MRLPKSYNDITVSQFQQCYFLLGQSPNIEQWISVLSVLSGKPESVFLNMHRQKLKRCIYRLQFLLKPELNTKVKKYIYCGGRIYKAIYQASDLNGAQGIDLKNFQRPVDGQHYLDTIIENADKLLACIYLPLRGFRFKYDGEFHPNAAKELSQAKMGDVFGTLFFYSNVFEKLTKVSEDSGNQALQTIQEHMKTLEEWTRSNHLGVTGVGR